MNLELSCALLLVVSMSGHVDFSAVLAWNKINYTRSFTFLYRVFWMYQNFHAGHFLFTSHHTFVFFIVDTDDGHCIMTETFV